MEDLGEEKKRMVEFLSKDYSDFDDFASSKSFSVKRSRQARFDFRDALNRLEESRSTGRFVKSRKDYHKAPSRKVLDENRTLNRRGLLKNPVPTSVDACLYYPTDEIFCIDIDVDKEDGGNVLPSLRFFDLILGIDIVDSTFVVTSPSGGLHCYFSVPEEYREDLRSVWKMESKGILDSFVPGASTIGLKVDFRGGNRTSALVCPGSASVDGSVYGVVVSKKFKKANPIYELSSDQCLKLVELFEAYSSANSSSAKSARKRVVSNPKKRKSAASIKAPKKIETILRKGKRSIVFSGYLLELTKVLKKIPNYHKRRYFIFKNCCPDSALLFAYLCIATGSHYDSSNHSELTALQLYQDYENLLSKDGIEKICGRYCVKCHTSESLNSRKRFRVDYSEGPRVDRSVPAKSEDSLSGLKFHQYSTKQVLDYNACYQELSDGERKSSKSIDLAMFILVGYVDPAIQAGCNGSIRLSIAHISDTLKVSPNSVSYALRLLRKAGVLDKLDEKSRQKGLGKVPHYTVSSYFINHTASMELNLLNLANLSEGWRIGHMLVGFRDTDEVFDVVNGSFYGGILFSSPSAKKEALKSAQRAESYLMVDLDLLRFDNYSTITEKSRTCPSSKLSNSDIKSFQLSSQRVMRNSNGAVSCIKDISMPNYKLLSLKITRDPKRLDVAKRIWNSYYGSVADSVENGSYRAYQNLSTEDLMRFIEFSENGMKKLVPLELRGYKTKYHRSFYQAEDNRKLMLTGERLVRARMTDQKWAKNELPSSSVFADQLIRRYQEILKGNY